MMLRAPWLRAAPAALMLLALAACANAPDTRPDKPFQTAELCLGSDVPDGWIRTNDWRGKGCGVESEMSARDQTASRMQLVSATVLPKAKRKAATDVSRGANAVASDGPNNWMTITEIAHARIGRSISVCAGPVPKGWTEKTRYWDSGRCGNPTKRSIRNMMLIERVS